MKGVTGMADLADTGVRSMTTNRAYVAAVAKMAVWIGALCMAAALGSALAIPAALADGADYHTQGAQTLPAGTASASASSTETFSTEAGPADADLEAQRADADLEAQLAKAREQLAQAARQVASLSAQLGMSASRVMIRRAFRGGVIGLQLDPASGTGGARVLEVSPGGPAADGGVRPGDVIVAVNGASVSGPDAAQQVVERMSRVAPNTKVQLRVTRGGRVQQLELTTRPAVVFAFASSATDGAAPSLPAMPALPAMPQVPGPVAAVPPLSNMQYFQALSAETAGMELAALTPELGKYFGTADGVLVIRSPTDDAFGLQDGDVILSIDGRKPLNGAHATRILGSYQPGERITLRIMRQRKPMSLTITLPTAPR